MKVIMLFSLLLISSLFLSISPVNACTSFAVYTNDKIFYGMNFDYSNVELDFSILHENSTKIFQANFIENGVSGVVCGMNNKGMFSSIQMLYPQVTNWPAQKLNEIDLYQAFISTLMNFDSLQQAITYLDVTGTRVIHIEGLSLHDFFADIHKSAYVLEVGTDKNLLTKMENDFIVMTNFPNNQFEGKSLSEITGAGADRYKTAFQYIQNNKNNFNFENGIETLKRTVQSGGNFPTQVSFLCDPVNNEVYIILKRNFAQVWKLSIKDETIETFAGFETYKKISIPESGISASELLHLTSVNEPFLPKKTVLNQNYPNPFNPVTIISYEIPVHSYVVLKVYDILGKEVAALVNKEQNPGKYEVTFDGSGLSSGVYFYSLQAGDFSEIKKLILLE